MHRQTGGEIHCGVSQDEARSHSRETFWVRKRLDLLVTPSAVVFSDESLSSREIHWLRSEDEAGQKTF